MVVKVKRPRLQKCLYRYCDEKFKPKVNKAREKLYCSPTCRMWDYRFRRVKK